MKKLPFVVLLLLVGHFTVAQNNLPVDMVLVEGGLFGNRPSDHVSNSTKTLFYHEIPSFRMSTTEVSVQDFKQFCKETKRAMPSDPGWGWGDPKRPMVNITYIDAMDYCAWMTKKHGLSFALPTQQQWEYAARAGNFDTLDFAYNEELPNPYVIYMGNNKEKPECITCMQPNEMGFYAMVGNVWEWVLAEDGDHGQATVMGGSFFEDVDHVLVDSKRKYSKYLRRQDIGFRVVINPN